MTYQFMASLVAAAGSAVRSVRVTRTDGQVFYAQVPLGQGFTDHFTGAAQNFQRVVFDPTRTRENLLVFLLGQRDHTGCLVKHHKARAGSALIDRANVTLQESGPSRNRRYGEGISAHLLIRANL